MNFETLTELINDLKTMTPQDAMLQETLLNDLKYAIGGCQERVRRYKEEQASLRLKAIKEEIQFQEPEFERYDEEEDDETPPAEGSAVFFSEEQAKEFIKLMNDKANHYSSYRYYTIDWQGPGKYRTETKSDFRCGDLEYNARFIKE